MPFIYGPSTDTPYLLIGCASLPLCWDPAGFIPFVLTATLVYTGVSSTFVRTCGNHYPMSALLDCSDGLLRPNLHNVRSGRRPRVFSMRAFR
ncbi:hypothetical protein CGRA01v4_08884 [Colletotrichum graminicola]|nr:hypothetical protein CGRA01v4_08884 [Colletotrichum graminicola]